MSKKVIKTSLILILMMVTLTLASSWHMNNIASGPSKLITCTEHIDVDLDMVCDACAKNLPFLAEGKAQTIETTSTDGSLVRIAGYMPENSDVVSKELEKETATRLAKEYIKELQAEDILYAYDISMYADDKKYQPEDENKSVDVTISKLDLLDKENVRLLHITEDGSYELIKPRKIAQNEITFKATSFSTYIVITVASHEVTFTGTGNFEIRNTKGKVITNGTTVNSGYDFNFIVIPKINYGVTEVVVTNASGTVIDSIITGTNTGKTVKIDEVTDDLTITVTTVAAPIMTSKPATTKVKIGDTATYRITAENTTIFEWQYKASGDNYWKTVTEEIGTITTNGQTSELVTKAVIEEMHGYEFRCLLGNADFQNDDTVKSNNALLIVSQDTIEAEVVTNIELTDANVFINPTTFVYDGEEKKPTVTVTVAGKVLEENTDYTVKYENNINVGTGTVTVTGMGTYKGEVIKEFTITEASFSGDVTIKGTNKYGETLTADISRIEPEADSLEYVWWYSDDENATSGEVIEGATSQEYTIGKGLIGKYIGVTVTARKANYFDKVFTDITDAENNGTAKVEKADRVVTIDKRIEIETTKTGIIEFTYTGEDVETEVTSNDEEIATVIVADGNLGGTITITSVNPGECEITLTIPESENYKAAEEKIIVTIVRRAKLDAPTNFEATIGESENSITVTWTNISEEAKYELYAKTTDGDWVLLGSNVVTPYVHSKLPSNTIYEYKLRAYNDEGLYSDFVYTNGSTAGKQSISGDVILDTVNPVIEFVSHDINGNYIRQDSIVTINFTATDLNYCKEYNKIDLENIVIKVGETAITPLDFSIVKTDIENGENHAMQIKIPYTSVNGELSVIVQRDSVKDKALNGNITTEMKTGLIVFNSTITDDAPTLEVKGNTITVTCNQTTNIEPDNVIIFYEYRKSGDTSFIRTTENRLTGLEFETDYEVRTFLVDVTGNSKVSNSSFAKTEKAIPILTLDVVSPESGTYIFGTEITIEGSFDTSVTIIESPKLTVKFGSGDGIELVGELDTTRNVIVYKYTTTKEDLGWLTGVKFVGSVEDAKGEIINYNDEVTLGGNKIYARTGAKLIEDGVETYYPYVQDAIDAANDEGKPSTVVLLQTEENKEPIAIEEDKNIELDLNGKDIITKADEAVTIINDGKLTIKDDIGTSEITSQGEEAAKTIINNGTLEIIGGQIKAKVEDETGSAIAIQNFGETTIGEDDGDINIDIPVIDSDEYGIVNEAGGNVNFNDGVIIGDVNKSYSGDITVPAGYDIVTERIEGGREKTYIGVDKMPPILKHTIITKGWRKDYIEVEIYAYDEETGIKFVTIDNEEIEIDGITTIVQFTENKEYIVYAEDFAGNSTTDSIIIETLDKEAPIISSVTMSEEVSDDGVEVIVEVQDLASGLAGVIIKTVDEIPDDTEDWIEFNMYPTSKQHVSITLTKNNKYYCFAKDRVGNISRYNNEIVVSNIDKIKPTIESVRVIKDEGKDYVSGKAVIVDVVAKDNIGVSEILISNELLEGDEIRTSSEWQAYNQYIVHELPIDYDGVYNIYVWVKDATGNISLYASTSVELKALVVGDNMYDYTGSDTIYNKSKLRFRVKDQNYDFDSIVEDGEIILRLTIGSQVIRNITTGIKVNELSKYDGYNDDYDYEGIDYELEMQNLPGTGELNLVILKDSLIDLARNQIDGTVVPTDMFVDNNPPVLTVINTGTTDADGIEIREIRASDNEGYLLNFIEITTEGVTRTYALTDGKATIPVPNGSKIVAFDKAGNEGTHVVGKTVKPAFIVSENVMFTYGDAAKTINYTYDGDGIVTAISSDTNIANVSINQDTKQITISPVNAGNCEITIRTTETENYSEVKKSILVTVSPLPVELSWSTSVFDYDGTRKYVYATVENAILSDVVEAVQYKNNNKINAGTYRAEVLELNNENYTVEGGDNVTLDWRINKINRNLELSSVADELERSTTKKITFSYDGEKAEAIVTSSNEDIAKAKIINYENSGEVAIEGIEYGNAVITVTIPESTNYNEVSKTFDASVYVFVRVYFITYGGEPINSILVRYNEPYGTLPNAVKTGSTFKGWYLEEEFINEVDSTTIVINITEHRLHAKYKIKLNSTVNMSGYTYGGTKSTPTVTNNLGNGAVTYYYNTTNSNTGGAPWSNVTSSTYLSAGTYYMYATIAETEEYDSHLTPAVPFTVAKANINPRVSMSGYTYGGTKSNPSISGNSGGGTVTYYYNTRNSNSGGTAWSSVSNSSSLSAGTYYMYATVGETANYNGATTPTVAFTISKQSGYVTLSPSSRTITSSSSTTTTISSHGGTLSCSSSNSSVNTSIKGNTLTVSRLSYVSNNTTIRVTVTSAETASHTSASATFTIYINRPTPTPTPTPTPGGGSDDDDTYSCSCSYCGTSVSSSGARCSSCSSSDCSTCGRCNNCCSGHSSSGTTCSTCNGTKTVVCGTYVVESSGSVNGLCCNNDIGWVRFKCNSCGQLSDVFTQGTCKVCGKVYSRTGGTHTKRCPKCG